jgi:hypothetical protein
MKKHRILFLALVACLLAISSLQAQHQASIYFESGQANLNPSAKKTLDSLLNLSKAYSDYELILLAYTDDIGATDYNQKLAQQRAQSTSQYLLGSKKLRPLRSDIQSLGELELDDQLDQQTSRQLNRRVDIRLEPFQPQNLQDLFGFFQKKANQEFSFEAADGAFLQGKQGGMVSVPPMAFVDKNGKLYEGKVHMSLQEAYNYGDMLKQNLATVSNGQIIETGGMIYLEARDPQGNPLQLTQGQEVDLSMPGNRNLPQGMQLFTADRSANNPSAPINWAPQNRPFTSQNFNSIKANLSESQELLRSFPTWEKDILTRRLPAPMKKPSRPVPTGAYYNTMEEPTLAGIEAKKPRRKTEKNKAYKKRIQAEYDRQMRTYRLAQKNNETRKAQHEKAQIEYARLLQQHEADSTRYEAYLVEMRQERQRLLRNLDSLMPMISSHIARHYPRNSRVFPIVNQGSLLRAFGSINSQLLYLKGLAQDLNIPHDLGTDSFDVKKASYALRKVLKQNRTDLVIVEALWREQNRYLKWVDMVYNAQEYKRMNKNNEEGDRLPSQIEYLPNVLINNTHEFYDVYILTMALEFLQKERKFFADKRQELREKLESTLAEHLKHYETLRQKMLALANELQKEQQRVVRLERERKIANGGLSRSELAEYFRYSVSSSRLGWINCDRFLDFKGEKTVVLVKNQQNYDAHKIMLFVVFEQTRSILPAYFNVQAQNFKTQGELPLDAEVKIVGVYTGDQGLMMLNLPKTTIRKFQQKTLQTSDFKKVRLEEFEQSMAQL